MSADPIDPTPQETAPTPARRVLVYTSLILTIVLAVSLIVLTGVRWLTQRTPSSILIIHGRPNLADARITVVGGDGLEARTATITPEHDFKTPLFLETGTYSITVEKQGKLLYRDEIYVAQGRRYDIDLTHPAAPLKP